MAGINLENSGPEPNCFEKGDDGYCRKAEGCRLTKLCLASPNRSGELTQGEAGGSLVKRMDGGRPR